jgi:hypothetical protein
MRRQVTLLAALMALVFFLMSWCMIIQIIAARSENTFACHTSAPAGENDKTPGMEKCCQPGVLKAKDKYAPVFQLVSTFPALQAHFSLAMLPHPVAPDFGPLNSLPTAPRLSELSLLRI